MWTVALALVLIACGTRPESTSSSTSPLRPSGQSGALPDDAPPLMSFDWFAGNLFDLNYALQVAAEPEVDRCMNAQGLEYVPRDNGPQQGGPIDISRLYGITDIDEAKQFGYTGGAQGSSELGGDSIVSMGAPSEQTAQLVWSRALVGQGADVDIVSPETGEYVGTIREPDGCRGQGLVSVLGSKEAVVAYQQSSVLVQHAIGVAHRLTIQSTAYDELSTEWAGCLEAKGYSGAGNPDQFAARQWAEPRPSPAERAAASADVECKVSTDFVQRSLAFEADEQAALSESYGEALRELSDVVALLHFLADQ